MRGLDWLDERVVSEWAFRSGDADAYADDELDQIDQMARCLALLNVNVCMRMYVDDVCDMRYIIYVMWNDVDQSGALEDDQ